MLLALVLAPCSSALALEPSLEATQYAHTAWRSREGFPEKGNVAMIAQTPDGYLWLATGLDTLLRFDGARTVPWQPAAGKNVVQLLTTRDGTLWMGLLGGLASWKGGVLTEYKELERPPTCGRWPKSRGSAAIC